MYYKTENVTLLETVTKILRSYRLIFFFKVGKHEHFLLTQTNEI